MKKTIVAVSDLAAQIKQLVEMKNAGALSEEQFDQTIAKLLTDTSRFEGPSRRDFLVIWIQLVDYGSRRNRTRICRLDGGQNVWIEQRSGDLKSALEISGKRR